MKYIGIDPGVSGGIAAIDEVAGRPRVYYAAAMPETMSELLSLLRYLNQDPAIAVLEQVRSSPQMGVVSAFTFGRGLGRLEMALTATNFVFEEVHPIRWQNAMNCRTHGDKNISKARAIELFPQMKITHAIADAILMAEYLRRLERARVPATSARGARINGKEEGGEGREEKDAVRREAQGREAGRAQAVKGGGGEAAPQRSRSASRRKGA